MSSITSIKSGATSGLLDAWQSNIQLQQANKAAVPGNPANAASGADAAKPGATLNAGSASDSKGGSTNGSDPLDVDAMRLTELLAAKNNAKRAGQAQVSTAGVTSSAGGANEVIDQTIERLKQVLAKVMAQLAAVRDNTTIPMDEKLQQTTALASQAMLIQQELQTLMNSGKNTGTRVNTTA